MATFYPSSTNQRDVMPALYLRDLGPGLYPETSVGGNMTYLNFSSSGSFSDMLASSTQPQPNCVELPVPTTIVAQESSLGEQAYAAWRDGRNETLFMQTNGGSIDSADEIGQSSVADDHRMGLRTHLDILNGQSLSLQCSNFSNIHNQGLSLSLGTQIPLPLFKYQPGSSDISILSSHQSASRNGESCRDDNSANRVLNVSASPYGITNLTDAIPNSKYLKTAQQLLDEAINVQKALKQKPDKSQSFNASTGYKDNDVSKSDGTPPNAPESANSSSELSPSERQDLQNKVTKLLAMMDEVDRRYKQYYHQMQIVVSSFDAIAGTGAAKPYTALALQTISCHFRSLRDAIDYQIRSTRKVLGEQENSSSKRCGISRLRYIDQHLRQQRAMQQLGIMQQHAWRPQRGLPESSVSVLRAWLFEHFLHPYPNDSEKLMLARQTGLTRGQVANWFINARVRLWKPMVEEMYKEEFCDTEMDSNSLSENAPKGRDELRSSEDREDLQSPASKSDAQINNSCKPNNLISNMDTATGFRNETNANEAYMTLKLREQRLNVEDCSLLHSAIAHPRHSDGGGRFMAYEIAGLGTYGSSGGVSLTLGLQHCDDNLPASNGQQGFMAVRGEDIYNAAPSLGFGSSNLLHDFVA